MNFRDFGPWLLAPLALLAASVPRINSGVQSRANSALPTVAQAEKAAANIAETKSASLSVSDVSHVSLRAASRQPDHFAESFGFMLLVFLCGVMRRRLCNFSDFLKTAPLIFARIWLLNQLLDD